MRIVLDTNTLVSGIISAGGPPRRLLDGARTRAFELYSSATLLAELQDVLLREKFATRLANAGLTPHSIVRELHRIAYMVTPFSVPRVVENDPDDDHVLACAVAAQSDLIVSGDKHLHSLGGVYNNIRIVRPSEAVKIIFDWADGD